MRIHDSNYGYLTMEFKNAQQLGGKQGRRGLFGFRPFIGVKIIIRKEGIACPGGWGLGWKDLGEILHTGDTLTLLQRDQEGTYARWGVESSHPEEIPVRPCMSLCTDSCFKHS